MAFKINKKYELTDGYMMTIRLRHEDGWVIFVNKDNDEDYPFAEFRLADFNAFVQQLDAFNMLIQEQAAKDAAV